MFLHFVRSKNTLVVCRIKHAHPLLSFRCQNDWKALNLSHQSWNRCGFTPPVFNQLAHSGGRNHCDNVHKCGNQIREYFRDHLLEQSRAVSLYSLASRKTNKEGLLRNAPTLHGLGIHNATLGDTLLVGDFMFFVLGMGRQ